MSRLVLTPQWPAPPGVMAGMGLRSGGASAAPFDSLNLSLGVGDEAAAVHENRRRFANALGVQPVWMRQVHGVEVLRLTAAHAAAGPLAALPTADAAWTTERGLACTVGAADCMPVFVALKDGSAVAAAHAGWRGLAAGVLQATVKALCDGTGQPSAHCVAWLGPCIGPQHFEVGTDVLLAFGRNANSGPFAVAKGLGSVALGDVEPAFVPHPRADGQARWLANLPLLAARALQAAGLRSDSISADAACTFDQPLRFFSYRRDHTTGRHAACIWRL